jgi:hypothetical protein
VILADLAFLVYGWSKMSGFFYLHRFGAKRGAAGQHSKKYSAVYTSEGKPGGKEEQSVETEELK